MTKPTFRWLVVPVLALGLAGWALPLGAGEAPAAAPDAAAAPEVPSSPPDVAPAAVPGTPAAAPEAPAASPAGPAAAPQATREGGPERMSLWEMFKSGGVVGGAIVLMSMVAVALIVEHFMSIRRERLVPPALVRELEAALQVREYDEARQTCLREGSLLAQVIGAGLAQIGGAFGFFDMQTAMQEASEREISRLYRKLEYLSFIAATAPMLGLLGTVTGMILAFSEIAATEGAAKPAQLAYSISQALVTTAEGLIVAIPTMFFVSFFRNRIDSCVAEAETIVERLMGRFRQPDTSDKA